MKNYFYLFLLLLVSFQINLAQTFVSTSPENKKALVEKYTGINCNYCPCGDVIVYGAVENNPENIIVVKIHEGGYAIPGAGQPDFRTAFGSALSGQAMNTGNPAVSVNRHFFQNYTSNGGTAIGGCYSNATGVAMQSPPTYAIDEILVEPAYLNVAAQAEINYSSNILTVNTEVYYTDNSPTSTNYLNIALVQNNTVAFQAGSSLAAGGSNYVHNDRLVDLITGQWGEEINTTGQGSLIQTTHSYSIPDNFNGVPVVLDDLEVVVFVSESTQEVINVNRAEMDYNYLAYDLSVDSIDSPLLAGNLSENENITVSISNNGDNDISNFEISYSVDGTSISTESYTETISFGETVQFTFGATYDFSDIGDYNLSVSAYLNEDENESNNTISELITNIGGGDCPDEYSLPIVWRDNFECYDPFAIENIGDWVMYDLDGGTTWGANAVDFTNESYVGTGIIFNYPLTGSDAATWNTYEGNQGLYFFASGANSTTFPNDDWMISPEFTIDGVTSPTLSFWAKSITDQYGLERMRVAVGNSTDYNDFTVISSGNYIEVPTDWTQYEFDLSAYEGQTIRIAIHYVGNDSFVLQMDSFVVEGTLGVGDYEANNFDYFFNPTTRELNLSSTKIIDGLKIYNLLGQEIISNEEINSNNYIINLSHLSQSVYIVNVMIDNKIERFKLQIN